MISYENTKTVQDLVWNTGREYAGRVNFYVMRKMT